ncbi:MCE family protein [Nocardioides daejeonensis]|uniref:MCE family protein n=1 Tax=Nocardioides daejeonensis TaxID=1046556 RepID=UPI000D741367|nr:MCE family protein [Nocardioides daejeonensis]
MSGQASKQTQAVRAGVILVVFLGLIGLLLAYSFGKFDDRVPVVAKLDSAGGALEVGAEVKLDGVVVGKVRSIDPAEKGIELQLDMDPERVDRVPANVTVRVLPISIFGAAYVELLRPERAEGHVTAKTVLHQDTSSTTIELGDLLEETQALVDALGPAELATALETFASTLDGRGDDIGEMIETANRAVQRIEPLMPLIRQDLRLATVTATTISQMTPNMFTALRGLVSVSRTLIDKEKAFQEVLSGFSSASDGLKGVVKKNDKALREGIPYIRRVVSALYVARADVPRTFRAVTALATGALPALSFGPYMRIDANIRLRDEPNYGPGDCPTYAGLRGKGC